MSKNSRYKSSEDLKGEVLEKIKQYKAKGFPEASRIHELIMEANPSLSPRLWYGMPGYAKTKDSAVLCFFRKDSFISFGITESAKISNEDAIVASSWYITKLTKAVEVQISKVITEATA